VSSGRDRRTGALARQASLGEAVRHGRRDGVVEDTSTRQAGRGFESSRCRCHRQVGRAAASGPHCPAATTWTLTGGPSQAPSMWISRLDG
jgi:hypothetical protein